MEGVHLDGIVRMSLGPDRGSASCRWTRKSSRRWKWPSPRTPGASASACTWPACCWMAAMPRERSAPFRRRSPSNLRTGMPWRSERARRERLGTRRGPLATEHSSTRWGDRLAVPPLPVSPIRRGSARSSSASSAKPHQASASCPSSSGASGKWSDLPSHSPTWQGWRRSSADWRWGSSHPCAIPKPCRRTGCPYAGGCSCTVRPVVGRRSSPGHRR